MADVIYRKGQSASLDNVEIADGQILVTEDTGEMYVDMSDGTRKKISDNNKPGLKTAEDGEIFNAKYDNTAGGRCFRITALSELTENYNITSSEIILNDELNDNIRIGGDDSTSLAVGSLEGTNPWKIFDITLDSGVYRIYNLDPVYMTVGFYIALDDETYDQFRFIDSSDYMIKITKDNTTLHLYYGDSSSFGDSLDGCMPTGYRSMLIELTGGLYTLDSVEGIEHGDIVSLKIGANYDFFSTVRRVDTELSTVLCKDFTAGTTTDLSDAVMWFPYKPQIGTQVNGGAEHAEGYGTTSLNWGSHSEGFDTLAEGKYSHAENRSTVAGYASHAEGQETYALGQWSHTQGFATAVFGDYGFSFGRGLYPITNYFNKLHKNITAEELKEKWVAANRKFLAVYGSESTSGGKNNLVLGTNSFSIGEENIIDKNARLSKALGCYSSLYGYNSMDVGHGNKLYADDSFSSGSGNIFYGTNSFITGINNGIGSWTSVLTDKQIYDETLDAWVGENKDNSLIKNVNIEGSDNKIESTADGYPLCCTNYVSDIHMEGKKNKIDIFCQSSFRNSHIEGGNNYIIGTSVANSHIEGVNNHSTYIGNSDFFYGIEASHIEGFNNNIIGPIYQTHIEGSENKVGLENADASQKVIGSHIEGYKNTTHSSNYAHIQGLNNNVTGSMGGHVGGWNNTVSGNSAFAHGHGLKATGTCSFVIGRYNIENDATKPNGARFIVGNGTSDVDRSNAFAVFADGHGEIQTQGETDNSVVIKSHLDKNINALDNVLVDILAAIQLNKSDAETIDAIEQTIVSYLETKTVVEVEE